MSSLQSGWSQGSEGIASEAGTCPWGPARPGFHGDLCDVSRTGLWWPAWPLQDTLCLSLLER